MPIRSTVLAEDLVGIVADPHRGPISIVEEDGTLTLVTGEAFLSAVTPGTITVETERGFLRIDAGASVRILDCAGGPLDERDLDAVKDALLRLLSDRFLWAPVDGGAELDVLTHRVGALISAFLNPSPAQEVPLEPSGDVITNRFDRIASELVQQPERNE